MKSSKSTECSASYEIKQCLEACRVHMWRPQLCTHSYHIFIIVDTLFRIPWQQSLQHNHNSEKPDLNSTQLTLEVIRLLTACNSRDRRPCAGPVRPTNLSLRLINSRKTEDSWKLSSSDYGGVPALFGFWCCPALLCFWPLLNPIHHYSNELLANNPEPAKTKLKTFWIQSR